MTKCLDSGQVIAEESVQGMKAAELWVDLRTLKTTLYFRPSTDVKKADHVCEPSASNVSKSGQKLDGGALPGGDAVLHPPVSGNPAVGAWDIVHPPRPLPPEVETPRPVKVGVPKAVPPLEVPPMPGERNSVVEIKKSESKPLRFSRKICHILGRR